MVKTIKLNGVIFTFYREYPTKSMAEIEARHQRDQGYLVRTKQYGKGYANYVR
jgi:hypothetical protein